MEPTVEKLLGSTEKDKQRGGAEFAAGIIGGMVSDVLRHHFSAI